MSYIVNTYRCLYNRSIYKVYPNILNLTFFIIRFGNILHMITIRVQTLSNKLHMKNLSKLHKIKSKVNSCYSLTLGCKTQVNNRRSHWTAYRLDYGYHYPRGTKRQLLWCIRMHVPLWACFSYCKQIIFIKLPLSVWSVKFCFVYRFFSVG